MRKNEKIFKLKNLKKKIERRLTSGERLKKKKFFKNPVELHSNSHGI